MFNSTLLSDKRSILVNRRVASTQCSARFSAECEMDLALTYSLHRPALAKVSAETALYLAIRHEMPDIAARANDILAALNA